ncbi:MAG: nitrite reductase small subunit [Mycobacterium sp.]|jgi:nitrite reductase (NADH) small subunit|nr:nitrite reductase small subunit [Mycobacterium sp.]
MTVLVDRPQTPTKVWTSACPLDVLLPGRGVTVLLPGKEQAALFLLPDDTLAAVSNIDPFGRAAVMSRGLTGDRKGEPTVASPLGKQVFSLRDGRCLDDPGGAAQRGESNHESRALTIYEVRVTHGIVEIARR